jgi:hypothetical protein
VSLVDKLNKAVETANERGKIYGESHKNFLDNARMMTGMFPNGVTLKSESDFARFILFTMCTVKMCRYANNFSKGGHEDSIHDQGVYSFILENYDEEVRNERHSNNRV